VRELTGDGVTSALWDAPFSFTEQEIHPLDNILLATGDVLTTTCTYVNDKPTDVQWGESTDDDMLHQLGALLSQGRIALRPDEHDEQPIAAGLARECVVAQAAPGA
jgi:hypothetical protein